MLVLQECFGSDVTKIALQNQFWAFTKNAKAINEARAKGQDCKDILLPSLSKNGAKGPNYSFIILHNYTT